MRRTTMYYSLLIEIPGMKENEGNIPITLVDQPNLDKIKSEIAIPYLSNKDFNVDGYCLNKSKVLRIKIVSSEQSIKSIVDLRNHQSDERNRNSGLLVMRLMYDSKNVIDNDELLIDITNKILSEVGNELNKLNDPLKNNDSPKINNRIFIVHGHDDKIKLEVARFLEKLGFETIILHEQANQGMTIIEKIEKNTDVGYGIVLYTPCDKGGTSETKYENMKFRARQNVILEHGYLIGKLGRERVCALVDGDIEYPSDIGGLLYIPYKGNWQMDLTKELTKSGYNIDLKKL